MTDKQRYELNTEFLSDIARVIEEEFGYIVTDWGRLNEGGFYRPRVESNGKASTPIYVKRIYGSKYVHIGDFSGAVRSSMTFNLKTSEESSWSEVKNTLSADEIEQYKKQEEEDRKNIQNSFISKFKTLLNKQRPPTAEDALFKNKKLKPTKTVFMVNDNLYIPYTKEVNGEITGCQVRGNDAKWSLTGSNLTGAMHILNPERLKGDIKQRRVLLCEGYTTACEVYEARPNEIVVATAGIHQMLPVREKLEKLNTAGVVLVLDKAKKDKPNRHQDQLEEKVQDMDYIQPCIADEDLAEATDWNDVALIKGKAFVRKEITAQLCETIAQMPEAISINSEGIQIFSYLTNCVHTIPHNKPINILSYVNQATITQFCDIMGIDNKEFSKAAFTVLRRRARHANNIACPGVGIHKDGEYYVGNFVGARYTLLKEGIQAAPSTRPNDNKLFVDIPGEIDTDLSAPQNKLQKEEMKDFINTFEELYGEKSPLYVLLGHLISASYAAFSPFRSHLWITGSSGTGKSNLQKTMHEMFRGVSFLTSNVTEAGLLYHSNTDGISHSYVTLIDEAGSDSANKKNRIEEILMFAREAATDGESVALRGTSDQKANAYKKLVSLALSSTMHNLEDQQDISRFFILNIDRKVDINRVDLFDKLTAIARKLNPKMLRLLLEMAPLQKELIQETLLYLNEVLPVSSQDSHKRRTWASLIAGLATLLLYLGANRKEVIKQAYFYLEDRVLKDKGEQMEILKYGRTIRDDILNTELKIGSLNIPLLEYLKNEDNKRKMFLEFGVELAHSKFEKNAYLLMHKKERGYVRLFANRNKITTPIIDIATQLADAAANHPDITEEVRKTKDRKSSNRVYKIRIPNNIRELRGLVE